LSTVDFFKKGLVLLQRHLFLIENLVEVLEGLLFYVSVVGEFSLRRKLHSSCENRRDFEVLLSGLRLMIVQIISQIFYILV